MGAGDRGENVLGAEIQLVLYQRPACYRRPSPPLLRLSKISTKSWKTCPRCEHRAPVSPSDGSDAADGNESHHEASKPTQLQTNARHTRRFRVLQTASSDHCHGALVKEQAHPQATTTNPTNSTNLFSSPSPTPRDKPPTPRKLKHTRFT